MCRHFLGTLVRLCCIVALFQCLLPLSLDVPFGDVSGLPDPYTNGGMGFHPQHHHHSHRQPQQQQLHHNPQSPHEVGGDASNLQQQQESGYSTPNSKSRRIIREIIV